MKLPSITFALLAMVSFTTPVFASPPGTVGLPGGVSASPHNLNNSGFVTPNSEVCVSCHTPHHARIPNSAGALWNHASTTQTFVTYTSKHAGTLPQPAGSSKMCLSCHDGVTAVDNFGNVGGTTAMGGTSAVLGTDLSDDHPIGVDYPTSGAFADATVDSDGDGMPDISEDGIGTSKGVQIVDGKVECRSCHHSHNNLLGNFLRTSNTGSHLCRKCHTK